MEEGKNLSLKIEIENIEQQINNLNPNDYYYTEKKKILVTKLRSLVEKYDKYFDILYHRDEEGEFTLPKEKYYKNDEPFTLLHDPFTE